MRLADLMAVDRASPVYNEGQRRGMFYAQSWALMHYLMLGSRTRSAELAAYMAQLKAGASAERALSAIERDVAAGYVTRDAAMREVGWCWMRM